MFLRSAVAPDAKVKPSNKPTAQLIAELELRIRRYRARFCGRLYSSLNHRLIYCGFHYQPAPVIEFWS